jgi:hypothetical protein
MIDPTSQAMLTPSQIIGIVHHRPSGPKGGVQDGAVPAFDEPRHAAGDHESDADQPEWEERHCCEPPPRAIQIPHGLHPPPPRGIRAESKVTKGHLASTSSER